MKHTILAAVVAMLASTSAVAAPISLTCQGKFTCHGDSCGVPSIEVDSATVIFNPDNSSFRVSGAVLDGLYRITKTDDMRYSFRGTLSNEKMYGSLNRYSGELILHTLLAQGIILKWYLIMNCKNVTQRF